MPTIIDSLPKQHSGRKAVPLPDSYFAVLEGDKSLAFTPEELGLPTLTGLRTKLSTHAKRRNLNFTTRTDTENGVVILKVYGPAEVKPSPADEVLEAQGENDANVVSPRPKAKANGRAAAAK